MSTIFNLSDMILESVNIPDIMQKSYSETYLSTALTNLHEMNNDIDSVKLKLYSEIAKAESTRTENKKFGTFFAEFAKVIKENQRKLDEQLSRFVINADNFIDANSELIDKAASASMVMNNPNFPLCTFTNLDNREVPCISPYKVFRKEYRNLGKILQDLGQSIDDETRAKVIASVYNNLVAETNNDWLDKVVRTLSGCDSIDKSNFAECIYKQFVGDSVDTAITSSVLQQARFALINYKGLISSIEDIVRDFNNEVSSVAEELGALLFRNDDYILDIKTPDEGIADRKYRLSDYSFSQINQFMKVKANQITEICNLFIIAISIKMDCIMKYLVQSRDILDAAVNGVSYPSRDLSSDNDDTSMDTNISSDDTDNDDDDIDTGDDMPTNVGDYEEPEGETPINEPEPSSENNIDTSEIEKECYLLDAQVFFLERVCEDVAINERVYRYLQEDALPSKATTAMAKGKGIGNLIKKIIDMVTEKFQQFSSNITKNYDKRITITARKEAKLNEIKAEQIPNDWTIQPVNVDLLKQLNTIPYTEADNTLLKDPVEYFKAKYPKFAANISGDKTTAIKDAIVNTIIDNNERPFNINDIKVGLNFITKDFKTQQTQTQKDLNNIKASESKLKDKPSATPTSATSETTGTKESAIYDYLSYFSEADQPEKPAATGGADNKKPEAPAAGGAVDNDTAIKNYVSVSTTIMTAKLGLLITTIKKYDKFLSALVPDSVVSNN